MLIDISKLIKQINDGFMVANSVDPDKMPRFSAYHMVLHYKLTFNLSDTCHTLARLRLVFFSDLCFITSCSFDLIVIHCISKEEGKYKELMQSSTTS